MTSEVRIPITATGAKKAATDIKEIRTHLDGLSESKGISTIKAGFFLGVGAAIGVAALRDLTGAFEGFFKHALEGEVAEAKLNQAFKNLGTSLAANNSVVEESVRLGIKKGFTDDEQKDSLARLLVTTGDLAKAQRFQAAAMDLARLKGISLADATIALTKVEGGVYRALKDLGIIIPKGATDLEVLALVEAKAAGQAEAYGNTTAGAMAKVNAAWDQTQEQIGTALLPALTAIADVLADKVIPEVQKAFEWLQRNVVPKLAQAFVWFQTNILPGLQAAFTKVAKDAIPAIANAFMWLTTTVIPALGNLFEWLRVNILPPLQKLFQSFADNIIPALQKVFGDFTDTVRDHWPAIEKIIAHLAPVVKALVDNFVEATGRMFAAIKFLADNGKPLWDSIGRALDAIGTALDILDTAWSRMAGVVDTAMTNVKAVIQPVIDLINTLQGILNTLTGTHSPVVGDVGSSGPHNPLGGSTGTPTGGTTTGGGGTRTRAFASGGLSSGGWAVVGERGRELMHLAAGTQVYSNAQTEAMLGGRRTPILVQLVVSGRVLAQVLRDELVLEGV